MASTVARDPVLITTFSPCNVRVPPSGSATSIVLGPVKRPDPINNSAPLPLKLARCISIRPSTIFRLWSRTPAMLICQLSFVIPNSSLLAKYEAILALWIMFLLGRQAMFGQDPPIYFRSTTTARIPFLAWVQATYLPASPPPRTTTSYFSVGIALSLLSLFSKHASDQ